MFNIFKKKVKEIPKTPLEMVWIKMSENGFQNIDNKWFKNVNGNIINFTMSGNHGILTNVITYDTKTHYFNTIGFGDDANWKIEETKNGYIVLSLKTEVILTWGESKLHESFFRMTGSVFGLVDLWITRMVDEFIPQINSNILKSIDPYITENDITDYLQGVIDLGEFDIKIDNKRNRSYTINLTRETKPHNYSDILIEVSSFIRRMKGMGIETSFKIDGNITINLKIPV